MEPNLKANLSGDESTKRTSHRDFGLAVKQDNILSFGKVVGNSTVNSPEDIHNMTKLIN